MQIAIRPRLCRADVEALVRERLSGDVAVVGHEEFTDGFFNAAHAVALADGRHLVVKVAPDVDLKLMRYEVDLMAHEIEFFERAAPAGVPLPKLWHADATAGLMIMDRLQGVNLQHGKADIPEGELPALRRQIGELSARIGAVEGELFGYPRKDGRTRSSSWAESFTAIIDDVLADAAEFGTELPRPAAQIASLIAAHRPLLDTVRHPRLVHYDLWDGNIFVRRGGSGWEVEAFIDGERAFYGDPVAELASLTAFIPRSEADSVVDAFLGRAPVEDEIRRLRLYRLYIWLMLIVECEVRGYGPEQTANQQRWASEQLVKDLAALES
ncbi:phosphotransferase family protein [Glycomyces tarimensis]